jgi:hypothetical protein
MRFKSNPILPATDEYPYYPLDGSWRQVQSSIGVRLLNGEDGWNDPLYFNASGYYGNTFSYDESPNYLGTTAALKAFDT